MSSIVLLLRGVALLLRDVALLLHDVGLLLLGAGAVHSPAPLVAVAPSVVVHGSGLGLESTVGQPQLSKSIK